MRPSMGSSPLHPPAPAPPPVVVGAAEGRGGGGTERDGLVHSGSGMIPGCREREVMSLHQQQEQETDL
jgi:hypothetical protein